ncbi:hypothetical protein MF672_039945 [Actinomadura sp. ATCC 31491]|uniref:Uncharacterized protein n=1 Tax=Actinomadura luzonensis TaxID=2805427 RepID=A0ABT0G5N2_9ACTN|nr:hypothetical protein [Actinomadura luzonensis]MCK2219927.1 hypothetical protein [Actinomadura luzonensis]
MDLQPARLPPARLARGYPLAVTAVAALLVFCAVLPWAGVEARIGLLGSGFAGEVRGIDDALGVYTLLAGLAALACGLAGLLAHPRLAALAVLPGAVATAATLLFQLQGHGLRDRVSLDLGLLSVTPVTRGGWFATLACALALVVLGLLALLRRAR